MQPGVFPELSLTYHAAVIKCWISVEAALTLTPMQDMKVDENPKNFF